MLSAFVFHPLGVPMNIVNASTSCKPFGFLLALVPNVSNAFRFRSPKEEGEQKAQSRDAPTNGEGVPDCLRHWRVAEFSWAKRGRGEMCGSLGGKPAPHA